MSPAGRAPARRRGLLLVVTVAYLIVAAVLTLRPRAPQEGDTDVVWRLVQVLRHVPGAAGLTYGDVEFVANVALFAPFGLLGIWWLGPQRWWAVALAGAATTVSIETVQRWIPGRVSDPRDLVANTLGTVLGIVCGRLLWAAAARSRSRSR